MFVLLFEQRKTYFRVQQAKKTNQSRGARPRTKTLQMSIFFKNSALFQQFSQNCAYTATVNCLFKPREHLLSLPYLI